MKILIPFTPHIAYECLEMLGEKEIKNWQYANSIHLIDYINLICRGKIIKLSKEVIKIQKKQVTKN